MQKIKKLIENNFFFLKKAAAFSKLFVAFSILSAVLSGFCPVVLAAIPGYVINSVLEEASRKRLIIVSGGYSCCIFS